MPTSASSGEGRCCTVSSTAVGASRRAATSSPLPKAAATRGDTALPICWYLQGTADVMDPWMRTFSCYERQGRLTTEQWRAP